MAAVAYPMSNPWVAGCAGNPGGPVLPEARVYRRRRALALLALVTIVLVAVAALRLALAGPGGGALTTSGSSGSAAAGPAGGPASAPAAHPRPGRVYVVQPGDTLWSIVVASGRRGDPRSEVDRLALQLGGRPIQPGQRLLIR